MLSAVLITSMDPNCKVILFLILPRYMIFRVKIKIENKIIICEQIILL
jgi:hypothetical protein